MAESLILTLGLLCCPLAMGWFALAMNSHWQQVRGTSALHPATRKILRVLGALALLASLLLCLAAEHPSIAVLVWVMALAWSALTVALVLAWRPRLLAPLVIWVKERKQ